MESNRNNKRKSFGKSKLLKSFQRGGTKPKADSSSFEFAANEAIMATSTAAVGFIMMKQDHHKPKVAFEYAKFYGGAPADEAVDAKASAYISTVQERFRLELINS